MMQVVGTLRFSSCNYHQKTTHIVTSCPTPTPWSIGVIFTSPVTKLHAPLSIGFNALLAKKKAFKSIKNAFKKLLRNLLLTD